MPYHVARSAKCPPSKPWACIKTSDGKVMGCHATKQSAKAQLAALYANEAVHHHMEKYSDDQPRVPAGSSDGGEFASGGGGGSSGGGKDPGKVQSALSSHKPSTKAVQDRASAAEQKVARMIGGDPTGDNDPIDVVVKVGGRTIGVEVKSIQDNGNNKITMHPSSLERKLTWGRQRGRELFTVVVDTRYNKIYYRKGAGSFRLSTLTQVNSAAALRAALGIKKGMFLLPPAEELGTEARVE